MSARLVVVEGLEAVRAARAALGDAPLAWRTTSPRLLTDLAAQGEDVRSPEADPAPGVSDALAMAAHEAAAAAARALEPLCPWRGFVDFRLWLAPALQMCLFQTCYKALLLQTVLDEARGSGAAVTCVGDPSPLPPMGLGLGYGRMETLFTRLAASMDHGPEVLEHHASGAGDERARALLTRRPGLVERLLGLLNVSAGALAYKAWRNLRRFWPGKDAMLTPWRGGRFAVHKECELLDELFLGLLLRGGRVRPLGPLPGVPQAADDLAATELPEAGACAEAIREAMRVAVGEAEQDIPWGPCLEAALDLTAQRAVTVLGRLRAGLDELSAGLARVTDRLAPGTVLLTNGLFSPVERLLYCHCRAVGVPVAAFEHGVTLGLSRWSEWGARTFGMLAADLGFYHNEQAMRTIAPHAGDKERVLAGVPPVMRRTRLPRMQRRLARRWLGIGRREQVVMILADLERNNLHYGPFIENDLQYLESTRAVLDAVLRDFPGWRVVLKLYPTMRYPESMGFDEYAAKGVTIVRDMDFRYIRAAADAIVLSSSQSTLGWALGSGRPVFYLDFPWSPATFGGMDLLWKDVPGLSGARFLCGPAPFTPPMDKRAVFTALKRVAARARRT